MQETISRRARAVSPDASQGKSLRIVPIIGPSHDRPPYELLRAQTLDRVTVTELDSAGSVPTLRVRNDLDLPVFLMDGQELIGAKQNRVLNTDVMVPACSTITIPVSCVEQGRWRRLSATFTPGKSASHRTRSAKAKRVHQSLKQTRSHDADQSAVWEEVEKTLAMACVASPTAALSDAYVAHEKRLTDFRKSLRLPQEAVGLAVLHRDRVQGIDLFDRHSTLAHFWDVLLDSYGIDLLTEPVDVTQPDASAETAAIRELLDRAAGGKWEGFEPPGQGKDWRLEDPNLSGSALVWSDMVVHLQLFPKSA